MNIFFCDLIGTFTGDDCSREDEIIRFVNNLEYLCEIKEYDELYFSFITSDNLCFLLRYIEELEPYLENSKIKMFIHYSCDYIYKDGEILSNKNMSKASQILEISENVLADNVIFADDCHFNHIITRNMLKKTNLKLKLTSLIPYSNLLFQNGYTSELKGIVGLNESLEKYIYSLNNSQKLNKNSIYKLVK